MRKKLFYMLFTSAILMGCGEANKPELTKEEKQRNIEELQTKLYSDKQLFNDSVALVVIEAYDQYATDFVDDDLSADYLFKAGEVSLALNQAMRSVEYFKRVCKQYPRHEKASISLFLQAYIYDNHINDDKMAEGFYREFIEKFPKHDMIKDAEFSIGNLGKSDEQLIKEFEAKQIKEEA
ncbi:MAG: tetratricopeptide repeat protein [Bacteroidetes bacterium]|nr:tetratricopeptide repeat protein [Bacteroidota bacterium]HET6243086.1 tetratricopeptide repeat protein [Bacteroidia bacterium]